jgi:penicillin-binding protein 1A
MRMGLKIGLAVLLTASAAGLCGFAPAVRAEARAAARRHGLELSAGSVRPGWGRVWLRDVEVHVPQVPSITIHFDSVEVELSLGLAPRRIVAHGGSVMISRSAHDVAAELATWRQGARSASSGAPSSVAYAADGVTVTWRKLAPDLPPERLWGVHYVRSADGREKLSIDRAALAWKGGTLELDRGRVAMHREQGRRRIDRVGADGVLATVNLDAGPLGKLMARLRARLDALWSKKAEPAALPASVGSESKRSAKWRAALLRSGALADSVLPADAKFDLSSVRLRLIHAGQTLSLGPGHLHFVRRRDRAVLTFLPGGAEQKTPLAVRLEAPLGPGPVELYLKGGPVTLATFGVHEHELGLLGVDRTELSADGDAKLSADGGALALSGKAQLTNLSVEQHWLAARPVHGMFLSWRGQVDVALDGSHLKVTDGELTVGRACVDLNAEVEHGGGFTQGNFDVDVPLSSCQALLDSAPLGLLPLLSGTRMDGTFAFNAHVEFDTRHLAKLVTKWTIANNCTISAVPATISPARFSQPWTRTVPGADGQPMTIESGPGTSGWVSLGAISPYMQTAVLVCEDGGFFRHHGFDQEAIRNSIRDNVEAGRFVRGASTISMQLAKNLYLPRRKTLSRKLQEALLTMLLEQELTKQQIMELYLNVIEFGPGIYGIGPAAHYYFGSSAEDLSLGQSLYLASILPNPHVQHFGADGHVTPGWSAYLQKLMHIAHRIHRISDAELADGLQEQVTFGVPSARVATGPSPMPTPEQNEPPHDAADYGTDP